MIFWSATIFSFVSKRIAATLMHSIRLGRLFIILMLMVVVYVATLDIRKAFDVINHLNVFSALIHIGIPRSNIDLLVNWYSKLNVAVRWKNDFSCTFMVRGGVRQGSFLSSYLCNVFINMCIINLLRVGVGCHVKSLIIWCVLYADDIIPMAPSLSGLQMMLNCFSKLVSETNVWL